MVHLGLSVATKTPELVIDGKEADMLADPAAKLMAELGIKPDPKFENAIALIIAAGAVYGPRAIVIADRMKRNKPRNVTPAPAQPQRPVPRPPTATAPPTVAPSTLNDATNLFDVQNNVNFVDPGLMPPQGE